MSYIPIISRVCPLGYFTSSNCFFKNFTILLASVPSLTEPITQTNVNFKFRMFQIRKFRCPEDFGKCRGKPPRGRLFQQIFKGKLREELNSK